MQNSPKEKPRQNPQTPNPNQDIPGIRENPRPTPSAPDKNKGNPVMPKRP